MKMFFVLALSLCSYGVILHAAPPRPETAATGQPASAADADLLDRFFHSAEPPLRSYRARRTLEASTMGGRMKAALEAWTYLDADGTFRFEVISQNGSGLICDRVLLKALEAEQRTRSQHESGQAELTPANYEFQLDAAAGTDVVKIGLLPRRASPMLLNGTVTVKRDDGDLLRIDGRLSKRPSWWTHRVEIARRYARINGVRVPVEMSSRADVRIAGDSSFSMIYDYTTINGSPVIDK